MKLNKQTIATIATTLLFAALGITGYDLTFHADQRVDSIENSTIDIDVANTEPLGVADFKGLRNQKQCEYQFIVTGEAVIQKSLKFNKVPGVPCGCAYDLSIPFYLYPQKVTVKGEYKGKESILAAVVPPEGFDITSWTHSRIWFVSKKYCKETADDISDKPKATK